MPPNIARIKLWIKRLRITKIKQSQGVLKDSYGMCCLGIAINVYKDNTKDKDKFVQEVKKFTFKAISDVLPIEVADWYGLSTDPNTKHGGCITLNDDKGYSFKDIATALEETYIKK